MNVDETSRIREPYEKPALQVMDLVADEVLGVGCKNITLPASSGTNPPCMATGCLQNGS